MSTLTFLTKRMADVSYGQMDSRVYPIALQTFSSWAVSIYRTPSSWQSDQADK